MLNFITEEGMNLQWQPDESLALLGMRGADC